MKPPPPPRAKGPLGSLEIFIKGVDKTAEIGNSASKGGYLTNFYLMFDEDELRRMKSSSSDTDEEEKRKLASAVDPTFMKTSNSKCDNAGTSNSEQPEAPPSKRMKSSDDSVELNEFDKPYSLSVTPDCQKFIAKQLSESLEKNIKGISPPPLPSEAKEVSDTGIKLFATSQVHVTAKDLDETKQPRRKLGNRKVKKKYPNKNGTSHSSDSESEDERLKSVAVSADWVHQND
ncbi:hypothetical protein Ocin01_10760 [Orchesella cincta]|uniref:Protein CUSTOS n=1 Tax=Orchesella cincta TaxID=48709 RepID=A0A1D2MSD6_ORCCI|nr:hypothetical protein Ocin01_10760 [Orchesella cincta]